MTGQVKGDELFLREDLQLIRYPTEIQEIPLKYRKKKIKPKPIEPTERSQAEDEQEEAKDPEILDETIEVGRRPRRKAAPGDVNNPDNFVGQRVRKKFGNDFYLGDITGYDDPYFQILYEDGDEEEMNLNQVKRFLVK